ncbi:MAG: glycosyltransferase family 39 protein [Thermoleophilia bacterium]
MTASSRSQAVELAAGGSASRRRVGRSTFIWVTVLCLVLALGVALRVVSVTGKRSLQGDEGVTYLAAAGHQLAYQQASTTSLAGRWVPASTWKSFLQADGFWGFTRIRVGLDQTDNHPPLYYWLLHVWVWIFGVHLWSGPLLNTLLALATGLVLFVLARRVLHDPLSATLVTALWIVSAPVVSISLMARDYELLALFGVLLALVVHRLVEPSREPNWRHALWLAAVVAGGLLAHYEDSLFVLIVIVAVALLVAVQHQRRRLWLVLAGFVLGVAAAIALNPGFMTSFTRQRSQASALTMNGVLARLGTVSSALASFFWWIAMPPPMATPQAVNLGRVVARVVVAVVVIGLLALAAVPRLRHHVATWTRHRSPGDWLLIAAGMAAVAATIGGYLLMQVPIYAMGTRYLALLWPFLALAAVCSLRLLPRLPFFVIVLLVLLVAAPMSVHGFIAGRRGGAVLAPPAGTPAIVFDSNQRDVLLRSLWSVPNTVRVFAGSQTTLLAHPDAWLGQLQAGDLLFTTLRLGGTPVQSRAVVALLRSRFRIVPYRGIPLMPGHGYQVVKALSGQSGGG